MYNYINFWPEIQMKHYISHNLEDTAKIADELSTILPQTGVIAFIGEIGAGKTTFIKSFLEAKGVNKDKVKSPTYNYIRKYENSPEIYHLDLYRIEPEDELIEKEIEELLTNQNCLILVEWADKILDLLPPQSTKIYFEYIDQNSRSIKLK